MLLHLGSVPLLVVSTIEMSMEITKTQDNNFATRPSTTAAKKLLYGCNDLGVQSFRFIREEEVALLIENISHLCQLRNSINLSELLTILSNNLISRAAFGSKFEEEDDNSRRIGPLTREVMPLLGMFITGLDGRLKRTSQELDKLQGQVIRDHVSTTDDQRSKDQRDGEDILDILFQTQKDSTLDITITRDNIKEIILVIFISVSELPRRS
uniref:Uncharacterized protein n=1 Tax=Nelumbo nucifera TaxID=4432 RepID=A0A822YV63_NELNU|nr:TPA_asm: hypothetical protein HUJ06_007051 [Nelumbo nucifera]